MRGMGLPSLGPLATRMGQGPLIHGLPMMGPEMGALALFVLQIMVCQQELLLLDPGSGMSCMR